MKQLMFIESNEKEILKKFEECISEKAESYGSKSLCDEELLSLALDISLQQSSYLKEKYTLKEIFSLEADELSDEVTKGKALRMKAMVELYNRSSTSEKKTKILNPRDVYELFRYDVQEFKKEVVIIAYLDTKNHVLKKEIISIGSLDSSIIHPREVFIGAIKRNAASIIISHKHPSGDPEPSKSDIEVTNRLKDVGNVIGIELIDHVIIGDNRYISFKEQGII